MCGRYALTTPADVIARLFGLAEAVSFARRFNISPTQRAPVVLATGESGDDSTRTVQLLRWGLIPFWAKDASIGARLINARSETAAEKPAFRDAIRKRRCIVPATGFFEWKKQETDGKPQKQPYFIHRTDDAPMALAGLWERWTDKASGEELRTYTILTTEPNDILRPLHNRMPVILREDGCNRWLDPAMRDPAALVDLYAPVPSDAVTFYPVSRRVNTPANDDSSVLEAIEEPSTNLFE